MTTKSDIIAELEAMAAERMLGGKPWPCNDLAENEAYHRRFLEWGLIELVPDAVPEGTFRRTPLGDELGVELFSIFVGHTCEWDAMYTLEERGFISGVESDAFYDECEDEANEASTAKIHRFVKRAYVEYRRQRGGIGRSDARPISLPSLPVAMT
jgi:hypothetical protein